MPIGICGNGGVGLGDLAGWTGGIVFVTTIRSRIGVALGWKDWAEVVAAKPVEINRLKKRFCLFIYKSERVLMVIFAKG